MFNKTKMTTRSYRYSHYARSLQYALLTWCIGIFASIGLLAPQQVHARSYANMPGGDVSNPAIRAVDIAKPAVVRIWTVVPSHLEVQFPPTTKVSFPIQANGNYPLSFLGTGSFISSQGDVLTADSVVQPPKDKVLNPALYKAAALDVTNYINQNAKAGSTTVSQEEVLQQLTSGQLQSNTSYDPSVTRVYLSTDYAGTFAASTLKSVPSSLTGIVDTLKAQSPPDQQDVAIVHVPMTDTPSVTLGNSDNVQQQDQLTVIGFPDNANVDPNGNVDLKPQNFLASSTNSVSVSSKKTSDSGAPLIQIGSNIDSGDNGAPAVNSQGEIAGVVSFGLSNGNSTNFLQASSSALKLAQSINLDMTPGSFQKLWSQAFEDYAATTSGHWHRAQQEFTQLIQKYPQFKAVQPFLDYAKTQPDNPVSATPTQVTPIPNSPPSAAHSFGLLPWRVWATIIGVLVLIVLVLAISLSIVSARKKKDQLTSVPKAADNKDAPATTVPQSSEPPIIKSRPPLSEGMGQNTLSLKAWPCGHMNRPTARFCSICGEAAPILPGKKGYS